MERSRRPVPLASKIAIPLGALEACFGLLLGFLVLITDRGWRAYPIADSISAVSSLLAGALSVVLGALAASRRHRALAVAGLACAVVEAVAIVLLWVFR